MSILLETDSGWVISHEKYFDGLKVKAQNPGESESIFGVDGEREEDNLQCFRLNPHLFEITHPFKEKSRKQAKGTPKLEFTDTTKLVQLMGESILSHPDARRLFNSDLSNPARIGGGLTKKDCGTDSIIKDNENSPSGKSVADDLSSNGGHWPRNNFRAVEASQRFFETVKNITWPQCHGHNPDEEMSVISEVSGCTPEGMEEEAHRFIFPPGSTFYCNDVSQMKSLIQAETEEEKFDLIVIDPPWWNKFIRRKKRKQHEAGYEMLSNSGIADLPIKSNLKDDGVVVVWCTNAKSNQNAVLNEIFPAWDVEFCKKLHWLKVTKSGAPVCPFNVENKKQPYEAIIIGARRNSPLVKTSKTDTKPSVLISIPSSINSHKPPLIEVLQRLYPHKHFHRKLEVFARYLTPGFTSFGNEVIKLQHISLYESTS